MRKWYGDSVLVYGTTLSTITSNWNEIRREFTQVEPYTIDYVQSNEFDDILTELCLVFNNKTLF